MGSLTPQTKNSLCLFTSRTRGELLKLKLHHYILIREAQNESSQVNYQSKSVFVPIHDSKPVSCTQNTQTQQHTTPTQGSYNFRLCGSKGS